MLDFLRTRLNATSASAKLDALSRSQAMIEFSPDGTILDANRNFLELMGYTLAEIKGRHHRMFVDPAEAQSPAYVAFWNRLHAGTYQMAQFKRITKGGAEVWIEASYNPVQDAAGKVVSVLKVATDITAQKQEYANMSGQIAAIDRSQAVVEFDLNGNVLAANRNFLSAMGYTLEEVKGRHHRMFVEPEFAASAAYRAFWEGLCRGDAQSCRYARLGRGGRKVWLEAAYNLVFNLNGKPWKVVKYATDISAQVAQLTTLKATMDTRFDEIGAALGRSSQEAGRAVQVVRDSATTVQGVAAGAEELAATASAIARNMAQSRVAMTAATEQVRTADDATQRLAKASAAMGGIVELIRSIAGQINLLALNATIESARAGEAGKGFAVVAHEVKNLAGQARDATDRIATEIETLQEISAEVVGTLQGIGNFIDEVGEYVLTTSVSVEEQSKVTQSISSDMQHVSETVAAINDNMGAIDSAVQQVASAVDGTREAARVLAR